MNVYDFDETIFHPDSSMCFLLYCLRHHTRQTVNALPRTLLESAAYVAGGKKDAKPLKEALFSFLNRLEDVERTVAEFWEENADRVADWYLAQRRDDDLIISASPEFLLRPMAERLGVNLVATRMNPYTGKISGPNCHDAEKRRRFFECYPEGTVERFYSDSLSDTPMAELAQKAFLVKGDERIPWPF